MRPGYGLYGRGFVDFIHDEMELGGRVAVYLDSENNTPEIHFITVAEIHE